MPAPGACPICDGGLSLRYRGGTEALAADSLSPTNHRTGEHGDLYECTECGTVHQPSLPPGAELAQLYRDMRDDSYLAEEPGRRRTASRLLDMVGRHAAAAAYARDVLGLRVHERTLEEHDAEGGYAAIVMADVLEHLDDPVGAIRRCRELLRPGGVLCLVTPDPSSLTARLAGSRWWGFLPAHTFLVPRLTLRELILGEGMFVSDDVSFVRTFSARYWLDGLAQRGGAVASAIRPLDRVLPRRLRLSLSLGDERVLIAHRLEVLRPPRPLVQPRGGERSV